MNARRHHSLADFDYGCRRLDRPGTCARSNREPGLLHVEGPRLTDLRDHRPPAPGRPGRPHRVQRHARHKARLTGTRSSGAAVELLVERIVASNEAWVQLKASHPPRPGGTLLSPAAPSRRCSHAWTVSSTCASTSRSPSPTGSKRTATCAAALHERGSQKADATRYRTVYAREPGAVAAPTAGLHFDDELLAKLSARRCRHRVRDAARGCRHVPAGDGRRHHPTSELLRTERFSIPRSTSVAITETRERGGRVLAVGTTSLRALDPPPPRTGAYAPAMRRLHC